jgi:hypothetical protein
MMTSRDGGPRGTARNRRAAPAYEPTSSASGQLQRLNPGALTVEQAARMLGVPREWLEEDLESGAPRNADGTINLGQNPYIKSLVNTAPISAPTSAPTMPQKMLHLTSLRSRSAWLSWFFRSCNVAAASKVMLGLYG